MSTTETTTSKTSERKRAWRMSAVDTLLSLRERFPKAFARLNDYRRKPLAIGIHHSIAEAGPDLDRTAVSRALQFYTRDLRYHRGVVEGAARIDLNGDPARAVTAAEAENSRRSVAGIEAKLAARRQRRVAESKRAPTPIPEQPKLTLAGLRVAAAQRKLAAQGA